LAISPTSLSSQQARVASSDLLIFSGLIGVALKHINERDNIQDMKMLKLRLHMETFFLPIF
jgi:hypothetical protein